MFKRNSNGNKERNKIAVEESFHAMFCSEGKAEVFNPFRFVTGSVFFYYYARSRPVFHPAASLMFSDLEEVSNSFFFFVYSSVIFY